jgi:hypothetical protein
MIRTVALLAANKASKKTTEQCQVLKFVKLEFKNKGEIKTFPDIKT